MDEKNITVVAIGLGLAASCGFRVFAPIFIASIATKPGIFPVQEEADNKKVDVR